MNNIKDTSVSRSMTRENFLKSKQRTQRKKNTVQTYRHRAVESVFHELLKRPINFSYRSTNFPEIL